MDPQMPQVVVGEDEYAHVGPPYTTQHPMSMQLNYNHGMPLCPHCCPPAPPSQISVESSLHYTHSLGATSFTTPNDIPQDSGSSSPAFCATVTRRGDMDTTEDVRDTGTWESGIMPDLPPTLSLLGPDSNDPETPQFPSVQDEVVSPVASTGADKINRLCRAAVEIHRTLIDSSVTECTRDQLLRTQEQLHEITEHVSLMLHQPPSTDTVFPAKDPQVPDAANGQHTLFKCPLCADKAIALAQFPMRRHVSDVHYHQYTYHCPDCDLVAVRRHRLKEHIMMVHNRSLRTDELEKYKRTHDCPLICALCHCQVQGWKDFYRCFISHCIIGGPSPSNARSSRPSLPSTDEADGGAGDDQTLPVPTPEVPCPSQTFSGIRDSMQQVLPDPNVYSNQLFGNQAAGSSRLAEQQPIPLDQFREVAPPPPLRGTDSGVPGNGRHPTQSDGRRRHSSSSRRPRTPLDSIVDRRNRIERPVHRARCWLACDICEHRFRTCDTCCDRTVTAGGCHNCFPLLAMRATTRAPSRRDAPGPTTGPRMFNLDAAGQNVGRREPLFDSSALGQGFDWNAQGNYYGQADSFNGFYQTTANTMGGLWIPPRRNNPALRAVLGLDENIITEQDMECSTVLDLKAPQFKGVLTSILPFVDPFKKWILTPLKSLSTMALSGLDLITEIEELPPTVTNSDPAAECRCKCRCRARTELASDRHMEMSLELSPDTSESATNNESSSQHLRTRVQIVVKLLRLRSSVATSNRTENAKQALEQAFAPTLGETVPRCSDDSDSETSDTESVFSEDELSISSSCADLQSLSLGPDNSSTDDAEDILDLVKGKGKRKEDVTVMFDFDLQSALGKLSKWSGGAPDSICSDLSVTDPGRVLEYLAAYVLYVMMALARPGQHTPGPRLSQ